MRRRCISQVSSGAGRIINRGPLFIPRRYDINSFRFGFPPFLAQHHAPRLAFHPYISFLFLRRGYRTASRIRGAREGGELLAPTPAITFSFSACTVLEFMPDGELMRDRFVVITRRRRRRDGKSRKTSGLASLSPRERAAMSEMEKQGTEDGEGWR